jgi:ketosteroid isomerase-like protein
MARMRHREPVEAWLEAFNWADVDALTNSYREGAVNHQVAEKAGGFHLSE